VTGTVVHLLVKTSHRTFTMVVSVPVGERLSILAVADGDTSHSCWRWPASAQPSNTTTWQASA